MYNHNLIEKKWQKYWKENNTYKFTDNKKKKFYVLDMFPYPSGKGLHVGHPKGYSATDVISRYKRLQGFDVLHPIGWDAFGLPAEQYAIDTCHHPADFTIENINKFREQLQAIGFDYDYTKEVNTTDPQYYQWTQWIFSQLFKHNLAEIQDVNVNWCENLKTTLSNEEVLIDKNGNQVSERGSHPVIQKPMKQWVLKITNYAQKLLDGLNEIDWPESLKNHQRNWIGKTCGYQFEIKLTDFDNTINVFIDNLQKLNHMDAILISCNHELLDQLIKNNKNAQAFLNEHHKKNTKNILINKNYKTVLLDYYFINPINNQKINVYLTDFNFNSSDKLAYVLSANINEHDAKITSDNNLKQALATNATDFKNIFNNLQKKTTYKLKDWVFSRQRYWGEPFPILFDENNIPILDENLPLLLPKCNDFKPSDNGESPLAKIDSFINVEIDLKKYKRDSNTMPQWAGSCWYYLGYILKNEDGTYLPLNSKQAYEKFQKWLPVDLYIGGQEHAVLHLLYARFWHRFLYDIKIVPTKEPFYRIINQGMILGENGEKMSKSKGNVISPNEIIKDYGGDALRLYECFMGPLTATLPWKEEGINGVRKWLDRVYRYFFEVQKNIVSENECEEQLRYEYHSFVKNYTFNLENQNLNLAISDMMIFLNSLYKAPSVCLEYLNSFCILLSCYAPHLAEEIWSINNKHSVCLQPFPKYDVSKTIQDVIKIPFQINGKVKLILELPQDMSIEQIKKNIYSNDKIVSLINDKKITKEIIIPNKIINLLVNKEQ